MHIVLLSAIFYEMHFSVGQIRNVRKNQANCLFLMAPTYTYTSYPENK